MPLDPPPPPPSASPLPPPPPAPGDPSGSWYAAAPEPGAPDPGARSRSVGARVGIGVGIVALIAVVASLVVALTGSGAGAGSPEDAVRGFASAVSDEDIVGAITMLPPSEVGSAHELYDPLIELLVRNGELSSEGNPLRGVDVEIRDLKLETTKLHDDIGKVVIRGGTVTLKVTADELDPRIREDADAQDVYEEFDLADLEDVLSGANAGLDAFAAEAGVAVGGLSEPFLMTIREGGRWYVSPSYTLAEYARVALGLPQPDFGSWRDQVGPGADSPAAVVESFAAALTAFDSEALIEAIESGEPLPQLEVEGALAPGEFAAFFDYMPVFERWFESIAGPGFDESADTAMLAEVLRDTDFALVADVDVDEREIGERRAKAIVRGGRFELHASGRFEGEAVRADVAAEIYDGVCVDLSAALHQGGVVEPVEASGCLDEFAGVSFDGFFIVTVERDGAWYFSPTETLVEYGRLALDLALAQ